MLQSNEHHTQISHWLDVFSESLRPTKIVSVASLRSWSLSQVFRLTLDDGHTLIAKRGVPTKGPTELEIYQECLVPLGIDAPIIFESHTNDAEFFFFMEDFGGIDLEQQPYRSHFLGAARKLAEIRSSSTKIREISDSVLQKHLLTKNQLLCDLEYVLEHAGTEHRRVGEILRKNVGSFSIQLDRLYQEVPVTLNHNDYHGKNLLNIDGRIAPIDWANACISPHLGDLYCLIEEAKDQHIPKAIVVEAYASALEALGAQEKTTDWYIDMGGLCWNIHCLQWIFQFGLNAIPVSKNWVPDFLVEICSTMSRLDRSKSDLSV